MYKSYSTFTFWAGLASEGDVYSTPLVALFSTVAVDRTPDFGPQWHWPDVREAPLPPSPFLPCSLTLTQGLWREREIVSAHSLPFSQALRH